MRAAISGNIVCFGALLALLTSGASPLCAQEAAKDQVVDVSALRDELSRNKSAFVSSADDGFVPVEGDLEKEKKRLLAEESKLLNDLGQGGKALVPLQEPAAEEALPVMSKPKAKANKEEPSAAGGKYDGQAKTIAELRRHNSELLSQLENSNKSIAKLRKELDETSSRLTLAEVEVDRLSAVIEDRNRKAISAFAPTPRPQPMDQRTAQRPPPVVRPVVEKPQEDAAIVTVVAEKAHLRAGPGKEHSPIMDVTKGTQLTVEQRQDDWYLVLCPTGGRAWISSDLVTWGSANTGAVRNRGYSSKQ